MDARMILAITDEANSNRPAAQFAQMLLDMHYKREGFEDD